MALTERQTRRKAWLENMLQAIEERLSGDIASGAVNMTLNGRSLQRYSLEELDALYKRYDNELARLENQEAGKSRYSAVRVRF